MDTKKIEKAITEILLALGQDINQEGLKETPVRVARLYKEIFSGIQEDPKQHLKFFKSEFEIDQIVVLKKIPFYSMCEHHLMPFFGYIDIAYIPQDNKLLGLSKFARIIKTFASRPQLQERLTAQIANFLYENLSQKGIAIKINAEHLCMTMRGIKAQGSKSYTYELKGEFKTNLSLKQEVLSLFKEKSNE